MTEETKTQKILKSINEEFDREKRVVGGMSKEERQVLAILVMAIAVIAIVATLVYTSIAHASAFEMDVQCEGEVCTVAKKDIKALIKHNNAVTVELQKQMSRNCRSLSDI